MDEKDLLKNLETAREAVRQCEAVIRRVPDRLRNILALEREFAAMAAEATDSLYTYLAENRGGEVMDRATAFRRVRDIPSESIKAMHVLELVRKLPQFEEAQKELLHLEEALEAAQEWEQRANLEYEAARIMREQQKADAIAAALSKIELKFGS